MGFFKGLGFRAFFFGFRILSRVSLQVSLRVQGLGPCFGGFRILGLL